jgi:hypothetical protein
VLGDPAIPSVGAVGAEAVAAEKVLTDAANAYRVALGERLLAAYALGSLAHGGFSPLVSDIDVRLIVSDPPILGTLRRFALSPTRRRPRGRSSLSGFRSSGARRRRCAASRRVGVSRRWIDWT